MLPSYFNYVFVQLRQKARLRPELALKFSQLSARTRPEKPGRFTTLGRETSLLSTVKR